MMGDAAAAAAAATAAATAATLKAMLLVCSIQTAKRAKITVQV